MKSVRLVPGASYVMPGICCSCGAPAGSGKLRAGGSANAGKYTVSLDFPLCDVCAAREKKERSNKGLGCLTAVLALSLALPAVGGLPEQASAVLTGLTWLMAIAMIAVVARAAIAWLFGGTASTRWGCLTGLLLSVPVGVVLVVLAGYVPPKGAWEGSATLISYIVAVFLGQPVAAFVLGRMGRPVEPVPFYAGPTAAGASVSSSVTVPQVSRGGVFSQGGMTVVFSNDDFGSQFALLNGLGL
ncbi:MAG: hypothetical protein Q7W16_00250 [Coriobacteriia bacterium]|nr:hypothetical protein [Coriobacteriia bacterium]